MNTNEVPWYFWMLLGASAVVALFIVYAVAVY